ncbi:MAG: DUF2339 domain-containing protein [Candidatus Saccharibacteria bacterium]
MISFLLVLAGIVVFIYLNGRINRLESLLKGVRPLSEAPSQMPVPPRPSAAAAVPPPPPAPASAIAESGPAAPHHDFEFRVGSRIFTAVGAVAVILGIGFFLRYAFERNLITELMRVVLGLSAGVVLLGLGEYLRKKFFSYGQVLMGTGLAILYLTFYAAFNYYGVFSFSWAFLGMAATTVIGAGIAIRNDSLPMAGFAQLGGFVTPFLVISGLDNLHLLFGYIAVLNIGMLLIALYRSWRALTLGSLFGTALVYISWHVSHYSQAFFGEAFAYLTLFFLIFLAATLTRLFITKTKTDPNDFALILFNPLFYFLAAYSILQPLYPDVAGTFAFGLALIHIVLAAIVGRNERTAESKYFLYGVGFLLLFVGIALQFHGSYITVGWAAEALVLQFLARRNRSSFFRNVSHVVFVIACIRFVAINLPVTQTAPWFNGTGLTFLVLLFCLICGALLHRFKFPWLPLDPEDDGATQENHAILSVEAYLLAFIYFTAQITRYYPHHWLPIGWSLLAFVTGIIALSGRQRPLRVLAYATFALTGFRLLLFDSQLPALVQFTPFFNFRALAFGITALLAGVLAYLTRDSSDIEPKEKSWVGPIFFFCISLIVLWSVSLEVLDYYSVRIGQLAAGETARINSLTYTKNAMLSVVWAVYAIAILAIGLVFKSRSARLFSVLLFGLVIFKVFLYDPANLNNLYRFVSFLSLGLILLLTGYLYNRYRDRISEFILNKE